MTVGRHPRGPGGDRLGRDALKQGPATGRPPQRATICTGRRAVNPAATGLAAVSRVVDDERRLPRRPAVAVRGRLEAAAATPALGRAAARDLAGHDAGVAARAAEGRGELVDVVRRTANPSGAAAAEAEVPGANR